MTALYGDTLYGRNLYSADGYSADTERMIAWTFSLDGHDYYVLNLGSQGAVVLDLSTGQWSDWSGSGRVGLHSKFGTSFEDMNIFGGLDGLLIFDSSLAEDFDGRFLAYAVGNVPSRSRRYIDCFGVYVSGLLSNNDDFNVILSYSDDEGKTWNQPEGHSDAERGEYCWTSLGMISPPGRIFSIVDDGAFSRVFNLNMETTDVD